MIRPKKIILISLDTLRADHLGCYGNLKNTSPNIDRFTEDGVLFRYSFSPASHTIPAHGSLFTGKYPSHHTIGFNQNIFVETGRLDTDIDITLAEILQSRGYQTAAFVSGIVLSKKTNLNAGFEEYDDEIGEDPVGRRNCDKTNDRVFAWLENHFHNDFFLFIHYFDIHGPYTSPCEFQSLFNPDDYENYHTHLDEVSGDTPTFNTIPAYQVLEGEYDSNHNLIKFAKDVRHYLSRYDSCIRYLDRGVGLLFDKLKYLGIFDDVLIIITSDHGEAFGENNIYFYHGLTVTREQIHIPLIIKPDKNWKVNPKIIDIPVSSIDIMPTILDLCGISCDDLGLQGDSLKRIIEGKHDTILEERVLTSENERQYALIYPNHVMELIKKETPFSSFYPAIPALIDRLHGKKIYWDSGNEYLLSLPFDQYQRYKLISDIVNKFRKPNEIFTILEVGAGFEKNLKKFLPGDDIHYLDKNYPEDSQKTHVMAGDIIKTGLQKFYDFIITVDVYEHIPPMERKIFIETLISHSTKATILAAPFDDEEVKKCEEFANEIYKMSHGSDHVWLKEHISNGLPSLPYTIHLIENCNLNCVRIPNGYLPRWFEMISTYLLTDGNPHFTQMMSKLYEFYNIHFYSQDNKEPAYRQFLVISKDQLPYLSDLLSADAQPEIIMDDDILLKSFIEKMWRSYDFDRGLIPVVAEKDQKISEKDQKISENAILIGNLTQSLREKNLEINRLSEQFNALKEENISLKKSISYRLVTKFHTLLIEPFFPHHSKRRKIYDLGLKGCRITVNEGVSKTIAEYKKRREWKKQSSGLQTQDTKKDIRNKPVSITPEMEKYVDSIFNHSSEKSPDYVSSEEFQVSSIESDIKLIAFYLPQFHPIPENDRWWGKGFTEWTNVTKAVPQFAGHYQPHLPDELGFYNLTSPDIQKRQIELAKQYGLYGFCFHYYWFNGKRLLEKPLNIFIEHKEFDFPFCICWANENWTRRWDGMDHEILMAHEHSAENTIRFIEDLVPFLQDPRYIKIRGKPLIILYRPLLLPDVKKMIREWKEYCRQKGIDDLYIIAASTFGFKEDPKPYGMDALLEFPPHFMPGCPDITQKFTILNKKFNGQIWDFEQFVKSKKYLEKVPYTLFKGICPGWDNTARKPHNPSIFHGANPKLYGEWLSELVTWAREANKQDERFIFINAWNEWAEGAYLEPDRKYGFGYLEATRNALKNSRENNDENTDSLCRIKGISDDDWLTMLVDSVQKPIINGLKMPGFPPEHIQKQFVGSSYEDAIREGYNFYVLIKKYAAKYGVPVDSTTKILDFGCGWGRITRILLKDFDPENIYGVDVDPEIISVCKDSIDGINFTRCNASPPLEFADNSFDIIYAYSVFSHLSEDYALQWIQEFSRILKPGGIVLATTQSGRFLDFCQSVRDNHLSGGWYDSLKMSFVDIDRCRKDYENGAFLFSSTGGGDYRDKTFYGEAIIPEKFIRRTYSKFLDPVEFVDNERILPQALFILQKKKMKSEENQKIKNWNLTVSDLRAENLPLQKNSNKIIVVSHDAHLWGAQLLALHIVQALRENFHYDVSLLLKSGGQLEDDFKKYSTVYNLERDYPTSMQVEDLIKKLFLDGVNIALCNTVVTGDIVEILSKNNIRTISLIHELPGIIHAYKQEENARKISTFADNIVFPAEFVKSKFASVTGLDNAKSVISPQGLYLKNSYKLKKNEARIILRKLLSIPTDSKIILAVGHADSRKGVDLFVEVAKKVLQKETGVYFIWTGHRNENFVKSIDEDIRQRGLEDRIRFVGIQKEVDLFYAGSDLYLMTSREDPFPSTILEAMDVGVPVIGFKDAGGFGEIINSDNGMLVPYLDLDAMSDETLKILNDPILLAQKGERASSLITTRYNFIDYIYRLLSLAGCVNRKVSVIVPNYNYSQYLQERLNSIVNQGYPIYEIILLDDCSSDNSIEIAQKYAKTCPIPITIYKNIKNSGSVFRQWAKGIQSARGDYIWIAEADDLCETTFLEKVIEGIMDDHVVLSYCNSKQIDECGNFIGVDYLKYTDDVDENKWKINYTREGIKEISDALAIKNTIPNVSATVFKKFDISEIVDDLVQFKIAGDWLFYVWLLQKGDISFIAKSLNYHRRHGKGVTLSEDKNRHFEEIVKMQDDIIQRFSVESFTVEKAMKYRRFVKDYLLNEKIRNFR